jgi:sialate O-acetylesterase
MKFLRFSAVIAALLAGNFSARAELKVAAIFGDNMVLQQQMNVPVWGWAAPDSKVTVHFAGQNKTVRVGADGKWLVKLDKLKASSEPRDLVVTVFWGLDDVKSPSNSVGSGWKVAFTNILVGEVWLASGQSNMEKPLHNQPGQKDVFNAEQELAAADYPNIRIFKVEKKLAATSQSDLIKFDGWRECSSNALDSISFSAAAYFFGREVHTNLNVPVGLVESSWGGTRIEPWTPPAGFEQVASQKKYADTMLVATDVPDSIKKFSPTKPTAIYNAMIAPIAGFALRGAIWYQGESNLMGTNQDNDYLEYADKMSALVGGWRQIWGEGEFPFYFVQIAPFKYYSSKTRRANARDMLPEFWTLQSKAARSIKKTGMVVTTDLVNNVDDIHPRDKAAVGHRLALLALDETYGKEVASESPVFDEMKISGDKIVLEFEHAHGGLKSRDGQPLNWFTIAGADGKFVPAEAKIVGKNKIEVSAAEVKEPKTVRFAWDETAQPNLCNGAGLPAEPFRTDSGKK